MISLDPSIFVDFADVRAHATNDGSGNVVIAKGGISITLTGVIKGDLKADDFIFGAAGSPVAKVSSPLTQPPSDDGLDPLVLPAGLDSKIAVDELPIVCPPGEDGVPSPLRPWIDLAELGLSTFDGRDPHRLLTEARGIDWIV